ncbi:S5A-REDUCTASE domain-containing protein [Mycena indigotica]|uniref:S5A-REDUCTASE domain-containing protein n=1 Tax=Mycena indigotica TaxID=2126181 RepID=A0A8H6S6Z9_9AGAR|nr:S5A-REDUCTASE domain-containing protein [Mycena indigotica]KAF7292962.1 S5A-REDUCTASE domain-containing protein [Mycena indigotica]
MYGLSTEQLVGLYNNARKWFTLGNFLVGPVTFFIDAPFGRFTPAEGSFFHGMFLVDGIKAWIVMELVSPTFFLYTFFNAPLSGGVVPSVTLGSPLSLLVGAYFIHYLNRAILSPLRTPSRSKAHLITPAIAVVFNTFNGSLLGAFFSSPDAPQYSAFSRTSFWVGLALWAWGFVGNVVHDEILLNLRRKSNSKGKAKESNETVKGTATNGQLNGHTNGHANGKVNGYTNGTASGGSANGTANGKANGNANGNANGKRTNGHANGKTNGESKSVGEHYAIPYGLLYQWISYPNYFCEWIEWLGFAIAADPRLLNAAVSGSRAILQPATWKTALTGPAAAFFPLLSPPWIFFFAEIILMYPRAYRGHLWYLNKFRDSYPKERRIVIPFLH